MSLSSEIEKTIESFLSNAKCSLEDVCEIKRFAHNLENKLDVEFICGLFSVGTSLTAKELIESHAHKGAPLAQLMIGILKLNGVKYSQNKPEAIFWLRRSYLGKNSKAGFVLFSIFANGNGIKANEKMAIRYLKGTADLGDCDAQYYYCKYLIANAKNNRNMDVAFHYLSLSAKNGNSEALALLKKYGGVIQ